MIRVVSLRKAALAGVAGALVWTVVLDALAFAGLPLFDIVKMLGTLAFGPGEVAGWLAVGLVAHCLVGVCWALVYAYFFWDRFAWPPPLQGLAFAIVPALLASLLGFANVGAKDEAAGYFRGFPSYWNIAAFYAGLAFTALILAPARVSDLRLETIPPVLDLIRILFVLNVLFRNHHVRALSAIVGEFAKHVGSELDFREEAQNALTLRRNFAEDMAFMGLADRCYTCGWGIICLDVV